MEASADSAGGYSGPSQESKIPESSGAGHWDSNAPKHLSMPRSGCRIKLSLCSFLSCPSLSPPHAQLVPGQQIAVPSRGAMSSGLSHSPGSGGYGRASRGVRAVQGHKSLAWVWAQSQRAHLESCGQGGPTAWGKTSGILQTLARRRLGLKASSKPISFQGVTEFLSLPLFMRLCDCVRKAPSIKLSPRLDRLLILLMCEFKHVSWHLKNGKNTLKSNKD